MGHFHSVFVKKNQGQESITSQSPTDTKNGMTVSQSVLALSVVRRLITTFIKSAKCRCGDVLIPLHHLTPKHSGDSQLTDRS